MVRILHADDDSSCRNSLRRLLTDEGHEVVNAENGRIALDKILSGEEFDVLITDGDMPVMGGRALLASPAVARIKTRMLLSTDCDGIKQVGDHWEIGKMAMGWIEATLGIIAGTYQVREGGLGF